MVATVLNFRVLRFQKRLRFSLLVWVIGLPSCAFAVADNSFSLSKPEIALLKRLNQIEVGAGISKTMLKAAPFVSLFSSTSPIDVAVTLTTNDWDQILGALTALGKLNACKTVEAIDLWKDVDGNEYSSSASERFFARIRSKASSQC